MESTSKIVKIKKQKTITGKSFRLIDFHFFDERPKSDDNSSDESLSGKPKYKAVEAARFVIQMFGLNEKGETCCIYIDDFSPFFFVHVTPDWTKRTCEEFLYHIRQLVGKSQGSSVVSVELIDANKLYGFTAGKKERFVKITFKSVAVFNKTKNLWYVGQDYKSRVLTKLEFRGQELEIYESFIPPILRYFHIHNVSPSGWVFVKTDEAIETDTKTTTCTYEYMCKISGIIPQPDKMVRVPYKICSFDIEASSSHGDFPVPKKTYKRFSQQLVDVFANQLLASPSMDANNKSRLLKRVVLTAFGKDKLEDVDLVYPKTKPSKEKLVELIGLLCKTPLKNAKSMNETEDNSHILEIDKVFEQIKDSTELHETGEADGEQVNETETFYSGSRYKKKQPTVDATLVDVLTADADKYPRDVKIDITNEIMTLLFPRLEGDKITFIGSTFLRYGEDEPYLNHCLVLGDCDPVSNAEIQSVKTELDILLEWKNLIQRENPDIIIGYNIFGFDYEFMFRRAEENGCEREFLKLSRKEGELCAKPLRTEGAGFFQETDDCDLEIENPPPIRLSTGEYNLRFIKMTGRLQIDLFVHFRRNFNLPSYKLDDVAGQNISDDISKVEVLENTTELFTRNIRGLHVGDFIHIELVGFTSDYYKNGQKFKVAAIEQDRESLDPKSGSSKKYNVITIEGKEPLDLSKYMKWGMAKDDVTPQDIFRLANGSSADRAIVAKYCIQDCNLVQHLMNKIDLITGYSEMSTICSVPIAFLITRGQSIKLTSFVAKKCREKNTLMPDLDKTGEKESFEGAIVLPPKCSMYMDNPVACVDYSSLYPSSMISQNFSHDSKVWTKEYDLNGVLVKETGTQDKSGRFIYDNLPEYKYIDIEFDNFKWLRDPAKPKSKEVKTKVGKFIVRWAQLPNNEKSILPAILEQLLGARAATRKKIKTETDPFMQNILEKRQLGYKETANSLYGQCGAPVSAFYEKDVAACTTATGRMMIIYAKRIIEEVYGNLDYNTDCIGGVKCKAEYVYGDSVANYTPIYIRTNDSVEICTIEELGTKYGNDNWVKCVEPGKQDKEFCELTGVESWTEQGWTKLHRVIRHELASKKQMIRVLTHTGLVDVTDDHSLLLKNGSEISPKNVIVGTELLHFQIDSDVFFDLFPGSIDLTHKITDSKSHLEIARYCACAQARGLSIRFDETGNVVFDSGPAKNPNEIIYTQNIDYEGFVYDLTTENHHFAAGIGNMIVHNTDSVFFTFNLEKPDTGEKIVGKPALEATIEIAQDAAKLCSQWLKPPMELSYEKTLMPFILLSKKRYVGVLYETDPNKGKMKYMGLAIKRRDSCDYLKDVYGGILNILMKENNIQKAIDFLNSSLENLISGKVAMDKLMMTRQLKSDYKKPEQIAHNVLANRIGKRDPGNKPKSGDRMKYLVVCQGDAKSKLGERIETPEFIMENKITIDYIYYIENQLMEPLKQLFGLALEQIWQLQNKSQAIKTFRKDVAALEEEYPDLETFMKKREKHSSKKIEELLFKKFLTKINNDKRGLQPISVFFQKK